MANGSLRERYEQEKPHDPETPVLIDFQTPLNNESVDNIPQEVPADFDETLDDNYRPKDNNNSSSLLVPTFFIQPLNLPMNQTFYPFAMGTPPKKETSLFSKGGPENRYQNFSILRAGNEDIGETGSLISNK